jgi:hypothetical protein
MGKLHLSKWWGLYALVPLMIALMVIDADGAMSQMWHLILLAGIVCTVCALALAWVDKNPRLVERHGTGSDPTISAPYGARRLYTGVKDEWESAPIRHSGRDD